ncbi:branched-chain amino acid ABC transporter permease [Thermogladius sp. KZ2Tp1]|uniref:branched-chain amino acid ABC transporter permease n=1 Tax=Thermogladius sp. KZ2Tp1 TaxID=3136289 RepID=UPI003DA8B711
MTTLLDLLTFNIVSGVMLGLLYGLVALGLTFVYGVLRFVNSAQGQFLMLGAYIAYWMFALYGISPLDSIPVAAVIGGALGFLMFYGFVSRLLNTPPIYTLIAAYAVSIILEESTKLAWGPTYRGFIYDIGSVTFLHFTVPLLKVVGAVLSLAMILGMYVLLYKTSYGRVIRSVVQSDVGAMLCGINTSRVYAAAFSLGISLTVLSGVLLTYYVSSGINPYMGQPYTDIAFAISVLGGLGSPEGALVGGLIYGVVEILSFTVYSLVPGLSAYALSRFTDFVILVLVLLLRPQGLFGKR